MITGCDYDIFSDISPFEMKDFFINSIKKIWNSPYIEEWENQGDELLELFFAKDKFMYDRHDKFGFEPNEEGEACFLLIIKKITNADYRITVLEQPSRQDADILVGQYPARLMFDNVWTYTLVLPGVIEENDFSRLVYNTLSHALSSVVNK